MSDDAFPAERLENSDIPSLKKTLSLSPRPGTGGGGYQGVVESDNKSGRQTVWFMAEYRRESSAM